MASQNVDPLASGEYVKSSDEQRSIDSGRHSVTKRLQQELMTLMMSGDKGISAFPDGDNLFRWIGTIQGPPGTVYEKLVYRLRLEFPSTYPFESPQVHFETPCFHPNVDAQGNICLDILKEKWTALLDVRTVLLSIQSLLSEPNVSSPLNGYAAEIWSNQALYKKVLLDKYEKQAKEGSSNVP
uniref:Ubiquitin-conjugating enzyme E2 C n=1 Tax=Amblyomma maculatum TaxID=34609 RepID=G3MNP4_AMBMU